MHYNLNSAGTRDTEMSQTKLFPYPGHRMLTAEDAGPQICIHL